VEGRLEVEYDGVTQVLNRGETLPILPGRYHRFTGLEPSLLLELSMPCAIADDYFENPAIPIGDGFQREAAGR
jgi:hypothetical protein